MRAPQGQVLHRLQEVGLALSVAADENVDPRRELDLPVLDVSPLDRAQRLAVQTPPLAVCQSDSRSGMSKQKTSSPSCACTGRTTVALSGRSIANSTSAEVVL